MRTHAGGGLVLALLLLAGCIDGGSHVEPSLPGPVQDPWAGATRASLLAGTAPWQESPDDLASGAFDFVVGLCEWKASDRMGENQFHLSGAMPHGDVPNGTAAFEVTVDWSEVDYAGRALRFVYFGPWDHRDSAGIAVLPRGQPTRVPIDWRGLADDTGSQRDGEGGWDLWLCTYPEVTQVPQLVETGLPFLGTVRVTIDLLRA